MLASVSALCLAMALQRVGVALLPLQLRRAPDDEARLREASRLVQRKLYVSLGPEPEWPTVSLEDTCQRLQFVYEQAALWCPQLDVRVLLPPADVSSDDDVTADVEAMLALEVERAALTRFNQRRSDLGLPPVQLFDLSAACASADASLGPRVPEASARGTSAAPAVLSFDDVCVGGTFDRLHSGHKVRLSAATSAPLLPRHRPHPTLSHPLADTSLGRGAARTAAAGGRCDARDAARAEGAAAADRATHAARRRRARVCALGASRAAL
eukprot:scaffold75257_cov63-Phaeocystis_antarctica.AAC.4